MARIVYSVSGEGSGYLSRDRQINQRTFLFPLILRREVLDLESRRGDHILVYVTDGLLGDLATAGFTLISGDVFKKTVPGVANEGAV